MFAKIDNGSVNVHDSNNGVFQRAIPVNNAKSAVVVNEDTIVTLDTGKVVVYNKYGIFKSTY
jgi:hypothetical protein